MFPFAVVKIKAPVQSHAQLVNTLLVVRCPAVIVRKDFTVPKKDCPPQSPVQMAHIVYQLRQSNVLNVLLERGVCIVTSRL